MDLSLVKVEIKFYQFVTWVKWGHLFLKVRAPHKSPANPDIRYLLFHMSSKDHLTKGLYEFMGRSPQALWYRRLNDFNLSCDLMCLSCYVILLVENPPEKILLFHVDINWSRTSGEITYLIFQVTPQDHSIEVLRNFLDWSPSWKVTILQGLVSISIYDVFSLSHDLTRPRDSRVQWLYRKEPLKLNYHPIKPGGQKHFGSGDINIPSITAILSQMWDPAFVGYP